MILNISMWEIILIFFLLILYKTLMSIIHSFLIKILLDKKLRRAEKTVKYLYNGMDQFNQYQHMMEQGGISQDNRTNNKNIKDETQIKDYTG